MVKKKVTAFYLSDKVIKLLKAKAEKEDRSLSSMANVILLKELQA